MTALKFDVTGPIGMINGSWPMNSISVKQLTF